MSQILIANRHNGLAQGVWREIQIPVDIPQMSVSSLTSPIHIDLNLSAQIVVAARIRIVPTPSALHSSNDFLPSMYAGQPICASLSITTSFHWAGEHQNTHRRYKLRFDVEEMVKDWLVSGRKRGDFYATVRHL